MLDGTKIKGFLRKEFQKLSLDLWSELIKSPIRRNSKRQILRIPSRLSGVSSSLKSDYQSLEPGFIEIGNELQTLYSDAAQLAELTRKVSGMIGGKSEKGLLSNIGGLVRHSLAELEESQDKVYSSLADVASIGDHLDALYRFCGLIEKISLSLRVLGLNIAVESNRHSASRNALAFLVQEIRGLAGKIINISEGLREGSRDARKKLTFAHARISEGMEELTRLTGEARNAVQGALEEIEQFMELSVKALEKAGVHSREISRQVGEVVVAIQFHDITRQQVEHILDALRDVEELCSKATSRTLVMSTQAEELACAYSILNLQVAHLKEVISEISNAYEKSSHAFAEVGKETENLMKTITWAERGRVKSGGDPFAELKSSLQHLRMLLEKGQNMSGDMQNAAGQASETASNLLHHVEKITGINSELHMQALNAIVKTTHLGEKGRALEVLAQEINRVSRDSGGIVTGAIDRLQSVASRAQGLKGFSGSGRKDKGDSRDEKQSLENGINEISGAYREFKQNSTLAFQQSESLKEAVSRNREKLGFLKDLVNKMNRYLEELEALSGLLSPWERDLTGEAKHRLNNLLDRYTMHKERDTHSGFFPGQVEENAGQGQAVRHDSMEQDEVFVGGRGAPCPAESESRADEEALGDNVDLF